MKIIDFHTHPYYNTTKKFGYDMSDELFARELKRAGITMAAGSALDFDVMQESKDYGDVIKKLNAMSWEFGLQFSDFFIPGIHIHPDFVEESRNELLFYSQKGVKLVGELVPYLMGCRFEDDVYLSKGFMELFDLCNQLGLVVSIHTGSAKECDFIAKAFKGLNIVMAHPAYGDEYESRLNAVKKNDNLFMDVSGTGIAAYGMLRYGIDKIGREKIVFGTDFPIYNPEMYVRSVLYEKLTDDERECVFYKNAEKLLGIG